MTISNIEKSKILLKSIETLDFAPILYINPNNYIQHNLSAHDGIAGLTELTALLQKGLSKVHTVRAFEDGEFVFLHTDYNFFGPKIGFDIFRFEDGLIVEHWDNFQTIAGPNPSGHTMIDGATSLEESDRTDSNKTLVKTFIKDITMDGKEEQLERYFDGDHYIQHNPNIADGLSGFKKAMEVWAEKGITPKYDIQHMVLGQGNFVLVVSEGIFAGKHCSFYDLFRVADGHIAEHWDVIEEILPKEQRQNANGKF